MKVSMYPLFLISFGIVSAFALEEKCLCTKKDVVVRDAPKHFGKQIGTLHIGSCIRSSEYKKHGSWLKLEESGFVWSELFEIGEKCEEQVELLIQRRNHHTQCANCYHTCPCEQRNTDYCAAHCKYCIPDLHCTPEQWSDWGDCSKTCGGGTRSRSCISHCGTPLHTDEIQECNNHTCPHSSHHSTHHSTPVDGQWSAWRNTTQCSVTCGTGVYHVERTCIYQDPHNKGQPCHGDHLERRTCTNQCPAVDGQWSAWRNTTNCSVTCGTGTYYVQRECIYHDPSNKGRPCHGNHVERRTCTRQCSVDGQWSHWRNDTNCSVTCGHGWSRQVRTCIYPDPHNKGKPCHGIHTYNKPCTVQCPEYHCDKLRIFHEIAEQATTNKTECENKRNTSSEQFVFDNCDVPRDPQVWKKGRMVYDFHHHNCSDIPLYTPVGYFPFQDKFTSGSHSGVAGVFVGCLDDDSGIKIATKLCDGIAEVIHIPSPRHSVLASDGYVPHHVNLFFTISS